MTRKNKRLKRRLTRTENALCCAICIIENEAGGRLQNAQYELASQRGSDAINEGLSNAATVKTD